MKRGGKEFAQRYPPSIDMISNMTPDKVPLSNGGSPVQPAVEIQSSPMMATTDEMIGENF